MILLRGATMLAAGASLAACASMQPPTPPTTHAYADFLVGRVANLTDDYGAASDRYTAALARTPGNQDLVDGAVTAALAEGDVDRARAAVRLAHGPDTPALAHIVRAADALVAQRWSQADTELGVANGGAAQALMARVMRVWARAGARQMPEIDSDLRPLLNIRPYGGLLEYQQAMALDYLGRNDEALAAYTRAAGAGMWLPHAIERNADLLARQGAREQAMELLELPANLTNPALSAAVQRLQAGQSASRLPLTPARGAAAGLYGLAATYLQQSDNANGLAALTLSLILDPNADAARLAFAQAQSDLHHGEAARSMLHQVNAQSPYALSARAMEAWTLIADGRNDEAIAMARLTAAGGDARAKRVLADIYRATHNDPEAEATYTELIGDVPGDWRLWFARGAARIRLHRLAEGEADLQHALQLAPDQPDIMNYLGYSWVDRGEHVQEGLSMIQRAAELQPQSAAITDSLGWAYFRVHDYARALDNLEHAVELEADDPTLNDHLGDAYWRAGRHTEARYQWQRALSFNPDDPAPIQQKLEHGLPAEPADRNADQ
ncbi:MAG: tetratricopeptide repeat protein [Proteobacteria bacterium]|nr:tetratricopeptide repeat protein [Pseudomonadota bacterium]